MAAVGIDAGADVDRYFERFFDSDDSDDDSFDGFDDGEIEEALVRARVVRRVDINRPFAGDIDRPEDVKAGWVKDDMEGLPLIAPFTARNGLLVDMDSRKPLDFFNLFFKENMWDLLVTETNRYAEQRSEEAHFAR